VTSGCGRPADRPEHQRALVDARQPPQRVLRRRRGDLGAQVEQHEQVAHVRGEERHLVGADDEHAVGGGDRLHGGVDLRARRLAGRLLDVGVVGGQRGLERALVQREQRRGLLADLVAAAVLLARRGLQLGIALEAERLREAHDRRARGVRARASSSAVWKATSSRWSTMYCATSFCDRENSSNAAWM
jgi:hypothetical protein